MHIRTAFLFPGMGAYLPGALASFEESGVVRRVLAEVDGVLVEYGLRPAAPLLSDRGAPPLPELTAGAEDHSQPVIYAVSVALAGLLDDRYGVRPDVVLGHSFGEIAALAVAGAVGVADGARVVCERVRALAESPPGAMAAVEGDATRAAQVIAASGAPELVVALENAPDQTVVSGPRAGVDRLCAAAGGLGVRATRLPTRCAFHHPMQRAAAHRFAASLCEIEFRAPRVPVYSDALGRCLRAGDNIAALLADSLVRPVRFAAAVRALSAEGVDRFVECGARAVLTRLVTDIAPDATALAPLRRCAGPDELRVLVDQLSGGDAGRAGRVAAASIAESAVLQGIPDRDQLLADLRAIYGRALEYPEHLFTADAELEADLGVDSVQRRALLGKVFEHYGLRAAEQDTRAMEYPTLAAIAELVRALLGGQATESVTG